MGLYIKKNNQLVVIANNTSSTISEFTGATSTTDGVSGIVPSPTKDDVNKFLSGDGTWKSGGSTSLATESSDGLMSKEDKKKMDNVHVIFNSSVEPTNLDVGDYWMQNY